MNIETIIKKEKRKYKIAISICSILTILGIISLVIYEKYDKQAEEGAEHFNKHRNDTEKVLTYIEPDSLSSAFFKHSNDEQSYRLVKDVNGEHYVINMWESRVDEIRYTSDKVYGTPKKMTDKVLNKLIDELEDETEEEIDENMIRKAYNVYFDMTDTNDGFYIIFFIFGMLFSFIAPIFLIIFGWLYIVLLKSIKHLTKDRILEVNKELKGDITNYDKLQVILTDNYLISFSKKILCLKYDEIFMMYKERRQYKANVNYFLFAIGPNGKLEQISELHQFATESLPLFDNIMENVVYNNPDVLIGDNKENKKALKEYRRELKHKK